MPCEEIRGPFCPLCWESGLRRFLSNSLVLDAKKEDTLKTLKALKAPEPQDPQHSTTRSTAGSLASVAA